MNFKEYREETKRTLPNLGNDGNELLNSIHMVLGMGSEIEELYKALKNNDLPNVAEELSDGNWYAANYCNIWNIQPNIYPSLVNWPQRYDLNEEIKELIITVSKLQDLDKKLLVYNKPVPFEKRKELIENYLEQLHILFQVININPEQSMENNINKLKVRFPEKFTQDNAINRNLEAERAELEK